MKSSKNRYEFVLGFVGLAVSLSAFKDELAKCVVDLGFINVSLAHYFFFVLIGLLISLYLHVVERTFSATRFGNLKVLDYFVFGAQVLFVIVIASPVILMLSWGGNKILVSLIGHLNPEDIAAMSSRTSFAVGAISALSIIHWVYVQKMQNEVQQLQELEYEEIKDLELADKLYQDKYYSQAILETFKILELHLYKLLQRKGVRVQRNYLINVLELALRNELITKKELNLIEQFRKMRNSAAHLERQHTKTEAEKVIAFVKQLIVKAKTD